MAAAVACASGICYIKHCQETDNSPIAILINNDLSERHQANIKGAADAVAIHGFKRILTFGGSDTAPTVGEIRDSLENIKNKPGLIRLFYLTGHGSLCIDAENPQGVPSLMLKDDPLLPEDLASWLGAGPGLIYLDQCYAPQFGERLKKLLRGDFLILSDKHEEDPQASCRGVSTRFWSIIKLKSPQESLFSVADSAWKEACPKGSRWLIGQLPF